MVHSVSAKFCLHAGNMKFNTQNRERMCIRKIMCTYNYMYTYKYMWSDNKVRELIAVKVLLTSLLNTTAVAFRLLLLGSYAPKPALSPPFKIFWNWFCGMAFRAAVVLHLVSSMSSKYLLFNISLILGNRKKSLGTRSSE